MLYPGWAESSLVMAENVVKTGWNVGRPSWLPRKVNRKKWLLVIYEPISDRLPVVIEASYSRIIF